MRSWINLLIALAVSCLNYGQTDFIVSEANTLGGLYIDSDSLYVVSSADRAHVKSILSQDSDYSTFNLALVGPGFYNYRDICKIDNYLFVTKHGSSSNGTPGIYRLDLNEENSFFQLYLELNDAYGLASRSQELYVNGGNRIYKVDISATDPELTLVSSSIFEYTFGVGTLALKVFGDYLYVIDDNGISKIDLDDESFSSEYISTYDGWGMAIKDENTFYLTFSDDQNEFGAIYELKIDTQEYVKVFDIEGFLQTYDIEYYEDFLFVTTLSGDNNKVVQLDLNSLSIGGESLKSIKLFPNPTTQNISISGLNKAQNYVIYTVTGRLIREGLVFKDTIDVSQLSNGIYFLQLETGNPLKFIKK